MAVNIISLGISAPSCRKWEKKQGEKSYVEFQKLRLMQTGKLQTATMLIQSQKSGKTAVLTTAAGSFEVSLQKVLDHMQELLEIGRNLPLIRQAEKVSVSVSYAGNLPKYGIQEKTAGEKYAERLREDRWDVRRLGDPTEWRLVKA